MGHAGLSIQQPAFFYEGSSLVCCGLVRVGAGGQSREGHTRLHVANNMHNYGATRRLLRGYSHLGRAPCGAALCTTPKRLKGKLRQRWHNLLAAAYRQEQVPLRSGPRGGGGRAASRGCRIPSDAAPAPVSAQRHEHRLPRTLRQQEPGALNQQPLVESAQWRSQRSNENPKFSFKQTEPFVKQHRQKVRPL